MHSRITDTTLLSLHSECNYLMAKNLGNHTQKAQRLIQQLFLCGEQLLNNASSLSDAKKCYQILLNLAVALSKHKLNDTEKLINTLAISRGHLALCNVQLILEESNSKQISKNIVDACYHLNNKDILCTYISILKYNMLFEEIEKLTKVTETIYSKHGAQASIDCYKSILNVYLTIIEVDITFPNSILRKYVLERDRICRYIAKLELEINVEEDRLLSIVKYEPIKFKKPISPRFFTKESSANAQPLKIETLNSQIQQSISQLNTENPDENLLIAINNIMNQIDDAFLLSRQPDTLVSAALNHALELLLAHYETLSQLTDKIIKSLVMQSEKEFGINMLAVINDIPLDDLENIENTNHHTLSKCLDTLFMRKVSISSSDEVNITPDSQHVFNPMPK